MIDNSVVSTTSSVHSKKTAISQKRSKLDQKLLLTITHWLLRNTMAEYGTMITDQANAAAESNGRFFFNKTSPYESIRPKRIGESIQIANWNAQIQWAVHQ